MIELGGKERELKFGIEAVDKLEDRLNLGIVEVLQQLEGGRLGRLIDLTWAGLQHETPPPDRATVAAWVDDDGVDLAALAEQIGGKAAARFVDADIEEKKSAG